MKAFNVKALENKIPLIFTVVCCIIVAALSAAVRMSGNESTDISVSSDAAVKKVIVLDAGHPTYL